MKILHKEVLILMGIIFIGNALSERDKIQISDNHNEPGYNGNHYRSKKTNNIQYDEGIRGGGVVDSNVKIKSDLLDHQLYEYENQNKYQHITSSTKPVKRKRKHIVVNIHPKHKKDASNFHYTGIYKKPHHVPKDEVQEFHTFQETHEHINTENNFYRAGKVDVKTVKPYPTIEKEYAADPHTDETKYSESVEVKHEDLKNVKIKHHHHHHHHNHVKEIIKEVPEPYPVEKIIHVPVEKIVEKVVHVPKPYPVEKIVHVPIEKVVEKVIHIPKPYPVENVVEKIVPVPVEKIVEKRVPVTVEKKVPYPVEKIVQIPVEKIVEKVIHVPQPYPVEKIINKLVPVPKPYPVIKPIPYPVEVKVPHQHKNNIPYPEEIHTSNHVHQYEYKQLNEPSKSHTIQHVEEHKAPYHNDYQPIDEARDSSSAYDEPPHNYDGYTEIQSDSADQHIAQESRSTKVQLLLPHTFDNSPKFQINHLNTESPIKLINSKSYVTQAQNIPLDLTPYLRTESSTVSIQSKTPMQTYAAPLHFIQLQPLSFQRPLIGQ